MKHIEIKKALQSYGLDESEIEVYLSVLRLGNATVREIAQETRLKRTTIYLISERLTTRGIMGEYKAKYGTHFTISKPQALIERLDEIKRETEKIIPQLEAIERKGVYEPRVELFRGRAGYITVLNDSLAGYSHEVLYLANAQELNNVVSEKFVTDTYIPTRLKRNIRFRQLVFQDAFSLALQKRDEKELRQTKFIPETYHFSTILFIYRDKVAYLTSQRELIAVLIESKEIAEMERQKFNLLWDKV